MLIYSEIAHWVVIAARSRGSIKLALLLQPVVTASLPLWLCGIDQLNDLLCSAHIISVFQPNLYSHVPNLFHQMHWAIKFDDLLVMYVNDKSCFLKRVNG